MINQYLTTTYNRTGTGVDGVHNCWSLVRLARHELFGLPLLPSYAEIPAEDKRGLTRACKETCNLSKLIPTEPKASAIATAWHASLCVHVGLVVEADGRLWILETDEPTGPCLTEIRKFESRYTRVVYYAD